jgi:hypothetical protein
VFVLVVGVMTGLGQAVARAFVRFQPLNAYRLDILGSIAGIAAFSVLSFLDQPSATWGAVAGVGLVVLLLPRARWWQFGAVAGIITLLVLESLAPGQMWSPYNKLAIQNKQVGVPWPSRLSSSRTWCSRSGSPTCTTRERPLPSTFSARWSAARSSTCPWSPGYRVLLIVIGGLYGLAFVTGLSSRPASRPGRV